MSDARLPAPLAADAHKGTAGRLLCLAGSASYPGAARLVVEGAQRGGAGLVTLAVFHPELVPLVAASVPEAVYLDLSRSRDLFAGKLPREIEGNAADARVAGPGLGGGGHARELIRKLVTTHFAGPLVLDADGLNVIADQPELLREHAGPVAITPHPGEAARLLGRTLPGDDAGRQAAARELAERTGAVCVLKGRGTVVDDGRTSWTCQSGNPGMATAGSGDVLAGLLGAYATRVDEGYRLFEAARAAVQVHARAGDLARDEVGERALIARDLLRYLAHAQKELERP